MIGVCNLCEAICGLRLTVRAEPREVVAVRGNDADPHSRGHICPKGVAIGDVFSDPDRLKRPVRRVGSPEEGRWEEIGWDEAYDLVADNLAKAINSRGPDAIGVYLGNPNAHSLGSMTHGVGMIKALRTKNTFSATSVDQLPHQLVGHWMFGHQLLLPIPDLDRTQLFLVFGGNPMASNGSIMTVPDFPNRLRALHKRGGRMVVFDPRRTETAKVADEHHFVRPGSDAFVLLAMLQVIFAEGMAQPPDYLDNLSTLEAAVADFTPELAERHSHVPADDIRRLAREFATTPEAVVYGRIGLSAGEFGTICQWAINCLNIVGAKLDRVGGAMFTRPAIDVVGKGLIGRGHYDKWRSRVRQAPEALGELPVSVLREEIETPGDGQIRTLLTMAGNPVLSTPDGAGLDQALRDLDFMASIDIYVNETTRHADVILPPTTALERDHYDLVFHALAVRDTARFTQAVFAKEADQRHDWQIYREIALRTIKRLDRKPALKARAISTARLSISPTRMLTVLLRQTGSGITLKKLRSRPQGIDLGPLRPDAMPARLQTKNKRIDLAPPVVIADLDRLRTHSPAAGLVLIGRRHKQDCNSWMHNSDRLTRGRTRHELFIHPDDLAETGAADGDVVRVASRVGAVEVEAKANVDMMRGVVSLPHGYGHGLAGVLMSRSAKTPGVSINDLTDPQRLDISGNNALNGVPVRVSTL